MSKYIPEGDHSYSTQLNEGALKTYQCRIDVSKHLFYIGKFSGLLHLAEYCKNDFPQEYILTFIFDNIFILSICYFRMEEIGSLYIPKVKS